MSDDPAVLVDREHGVERLVCGDGGVHPLERGEGLLARVVRDLVFVLARLGERLGHVAVHAERDELRRALPRVIAQVPGDDLAVGRQRLPHGSGARAVVHAGRQEQKEGGDTQQESEKHVPKA
jgi:hypothetical protein